MTPTNENSAAMTKTTDAARKRPSIIMAMAVAHSNDVSRKPLAMQRSVCSVLSPISEVGSIGPKIDLMHRSAMAAKAGSVASATAA